ncbi:MAG: nucleotidyltransferase family protein [Bacteroidetes bacterium]|nr:nucleotidyltransferase family protein [Bacteroidota bacterium]
MIFCAGLGTRFKPWTNKHPKALALVNGKTLLQRNIEYLQQYGIFEVVINVHHFADQIEELVSETRGWGSDIIISDEREALLDTGGGLLKAEPFFSNDQRFITLNADILTNLHLGKLIEFHEHHQPLISFGVTDRSSSRVLLFDSANRLFGWRNIETGEEKMSAPVNGNLSAPISSAGLIAKAYSCVVVFESSIFNLMAGYGFAGKFSLTEVYLKLAANHPILGYDHSCDRFVDVGKPESVAIAESMFP